MKQKYKWMVSIEKLFNCFIYRSATRLLVIMQQLIYFTVDGPWFDYFSNNGSKGFGFVRSGSLATVELRYPTYRCVPPSIRLLSHAKRFTYIPHHLFFRPIYLRKVYAKHLELTSSFTFELFSERHLERRRASVGRPLFLSFFFPLYRARADKFVISFTMS